MTGDEMVIEILRGIRADLADLRSEVRATNARLDGTNARLDDTRTELSGEIAALRTELGGQIAVLGSAMQELAVQQRFVVRYTKVIAEREGATTEELADLRARVERIEHEIGLAP